MDTNISPPQTYNFPHVRSVDIGVRARRSAEFRPRFTPRTPPQNRRFETTRRHYERRRHRLDPSTRHALRQSGHRPSSTYISSNCSSHRHIVSARPPLPRSFTTQSKPDRNSRIDSTSVRNPQASRRFPSRGCRSRLASPHPRCPRSRSRRSTGCSCRVRLRLRPRAC